MKHTTHPRRIPLAVLVACLLAGLASAAHATTIKKGPFLLNVTTTAITVAWQTDSASDSRVTYTPAGGSAQTASNASAVTFHQLTLTGLTPDTAYTYQAASTGTGGSVTSTAGSFRTAPTSASAFRFAVYGDNRSQPSIHTQVANGVLSAAPRFVLDSGDLSSASTTDSTFQAEFFVPAAAMLRATPLYPALGNHEGNSSLYYQYFAGLPHGGGTGGMEWYSFDYANCHFAVLDTNAAYSPGSAQYQWFVTDMQNTQAEWRFVMTHHPAYSSGTHGSEPGVDSYLVPLFEQYKVDAVFHGHDHLYERSLKNGVTYFVAGGGGAPLYAVNSTSNPYQKYALSTYHYMTIDINGTTATFQAHNTSGNVFDSITLTHAAPAPPLASFSTNPTSGPAPLTVYFTDTSTNTPTSWAWTFGDGGTSTAKSPSHVYTAAGTYTVRMTATNASGSSGATATVTVQTPPAHSLTVTASANPTTVASAGRTSLTASATDSQGHGIATWAWSDGGAGGTFSSTTAQNPTYTAAANTGSTNRTVTLTVTATCNGATPISASKSTTLTVLSQTTHTLAVTASANPTTVASAGRTALTASATDTQGHGIASWAWSDGGAGGTFSSATAQNPTYTAAANTSGANRTVTLTVTARCSGTTPISASASATLTVQTQPVGHTVTVAASASPATVASGGTTALTMTAADSTGHTGLAYQWSDNGGGGRFSSTTVRNPTYTAPANTTGSPRTVTLTASGICKWQYPWVSGSKSISLTVNSASTPHTLTVTANASPTTIASGGATSLGGTATDSQGHGIASWAWSDGGAGGTFFSATAQNPTYTAAANTTGANRVVTLTVTATCNGTTPVTASGSASVTVQPQATHTLTVTASANPSTVASAGTTNCSASATDSQGNPIASWSWADGGAGGRFSSASTQNPTYTAAANSTGANRSVTLTVTANCGGTSPISASGSTSLTVQSQPAGGHAITVTVSASPTTVPSAGTTTLTMTATDSQAHTGLAYQWSDGSAGGSFSPSATAQNVIYKAPANTSGSPRTVTLTATAICKWQYPWVTGTRSMTITVNSGTSSVHTVSVAANATPSLLASGGTAALTMTATDSRGHTGLAYQWSDGGVGGVFSPSATAQNPTYTAPANASGSPRTVTLTGTGICKWQYPWVTGSGSCTVTVNSR